MTVYEVVLEGRQGEKDNLNVFHYDDGGTPPSSWAAVATAIGDLVTTHLVPLCGPRVTWLGITYREDSPGAVGSFVPFPGGLLTGTNGFGDQADVLTMMIKKLTGGTVRPTYGWFMQSGLSADYTEAGNVWTISVRNIMLTYAEGLRVLAVAGPSTMGMVIKASNPTAPNTQAYSPVNTFTASAEPRTQRSRMNARGS